MAQYLKISFGGDLMCLKEQNSAVLKKYGKYDYDQTLSGLRGLFEDSDYVIANLETPISDQTLSEEQICFNTPSSFLHAVKSAGINFLQTCNNHCLDRGVDGLEQTLDYLDKYFFDYSGTYKSKQESDAVFIKEIGGVRVAVICCTFGTNSEHNGVILSEDQLWRVDLMKKQNKKSRVASQVSDGPIITKMIPDNVSVAAISNKANDVYLEKIRNKVERAKTVADIVIMMPHIGGQYNPAPGAYTKHIINWMSGLGCDIIVAGHPHVPLRSEMVNGIFCAYSLGNFAFTPGVGYYLPNVLSEYGIILHSYWDKKSYKLAKVTFSIVKNVVDEDGVSYVHPLYDLYNSCESAVERDCLAIDNEAIVNRFRGGCKSVKIEQEYLVSF